MKLIKPVIGEQQLLAKLKNPTAVKQDKAATYFDINYGWSTTEDRLANSSEQPFSSTTVCVIPINTEINRDIICLDCDDIEVYEVVKSNFPVTLSTKSNYGGHLYFKIPEECDMSCLKDKSTHSLLKKIDIFHKDVRAGILFDGASNGYYSVDSEVTEPAEIDPYLLISFFNSEYTTSVTIKNSSYAYSSPKVLRFALNYDFETFKHLYFRNGREFYINTSERNNTLYNIHSWLCNCIDLAERDDAALLIEQIVGYINSDLFSEDKGPLPLRELRSTVLRDTKARLEATRKASKEKEPVVSSRRFIACPTYPNMIGGAKYVYVEITDKRLRIADFSNDAQLMNLLRSNSLLYERYCTVDDKGRECVMASELVYIDFTYDPLSDDMLSIQEASADGRAFVLNLAYFETNPIVKRILAEKDDVDMLSTEDFYSHPIIKALSTNILTNECIMAKVFGDVVYTIKHNVASQTVPHFWQPPAGDKVAGGAGKSSLLIPFLSYLKCNRHFEVILPSSFKYPQIFTDHSEPSYKSSKSKFNIDFRAPLVSLTEFYAADDTTQALMELSETVKQLTNEYITLEGKFINRRAYYNRSFFCVESNLDSYPMLDSKNAQRRLYVVKAANNMPTNELIATIRAFKQGRFDNDLPKLAKYIITHFMPDEVAFSSVPNRAEYNPVDFEEPSESFVYSADDAKKDFPKISELAEEDKLAAYNELLDYLVPANRQLDYSRLDEFLGTKGTKVFFDLAVLMLAKPKTVKSFAKTLIRIGDKTAQMPASRDNPFRTKLYKAISARLSRDSLSNPLQKLSYQIDSKKLEALQAKHPALSLALEEF